MAETAGRGCGVMGRMQNIIDKYYMQCGEPTAADKSKLRRMHIGDPDRTYTLYPASPEYRYVPRAHEASDPDSPTHSAAVDAILARRGHA